MKRNLLIALLFLTLLVFCVSPASAARISADNEADFYGTWKMEAVYLDGIQVGFGQLEWLAGLVYDGGSSYKVDEARLLLSEGQALLTVGKGESAKSKESGTAFSDGKLTLDDPMGILGDGVTLWICDDGKLTSEARVSRGLLSIRVEVFMSPASDPDPKD